MTALEGSALYWSDRDAWVPIEESCSPHRMRGRRMRNGTSVTLAEGDRHRLETIAADRNSPQKHVWRARSVLPSARGVGTNAVMAAAGAAKTTVRRRQERFLAEGVDGLLRDGA